MNDHDHDWMIINSTCISCMGLYQWVSWEEARAGAQVCAVPAESIPFCEWEFQPFWASERDIPDRCPYCAATGYVFAASVPATFLR